MVCTCISAMRCMRECGECALESSSHDDCCPTLQKGHAPCPQHYFRLESRSKGVAVAAASSCSQTVTALHE